MHGAGPEAAEPDTGPGRALRLAPVLGGVWLVLVLAWSAGFWGLLGGPPRPLVLAEVALALLAALGPPAFFLLAGRLLARADRLAAEQAALASVLAGLSGPGIRLGPAAGDLAEALAQAARQATAAEREEVLAAVARLSDIARDLGAAAAEGAADRAAAAADRAEQRAALARIEGRARAAGEDRALIQREAEAVAADRADLRDALRRIEALAAERAGEVAAALAGREEIGAALARMEAAGTRSAEERQALLAVIESIAREREEIRAALGRMERGAALLHAERQSLQSVSDAARHEREEIHRALARMEAQAGGPGQREAEAEAARREREEIRAALARMEANAAANLADEERREADIRAAAAERDEVRAALARMEERTAAALATRELVEEERAAAARERAEIRAALERMEAKASAQAADSALLRADRDAALAERDAIQAAIERLETRALGTVEEERASFAATLARLEAVQTRSAEALTRLLDRRETAEDLARLRRLEALRAAREAEAGPRLPLETPEDAPGPTDWPLVLRALHFPKDESDREGFRALRAARRDRLLADCLQAAEDILTLLSKDGIYMDDLVPGEVAPEHWLAFAAGRRGAEVRPLGAIEDEAALALVRTRIRGDAVFRDASLHFLRRFDPVLRRIAAEAREIDIHGLAATRTGRAFMLLARAHGAFD